MVLLARVHEHVHSALLSLYSSAYCWQAANARQSDNSKPYYAAL